MWKQLKRPVGGIAVIAGILSMPSSVFAAEWAGLLQPIIPQNGVCTCPESAMDWGCVVQVIQGLINLGITIGTLFVVFFIMYAAVMMLVNPNSPAERTKAKNRLFNAVFGLVVMLSAWLVVDYIMKVLYDPSAANFGPWNAILAPTGDDFCIDPTTQGILTDGVVPFIRDVINPGSLYSSTAVNTGAGRCSPQVIQQAAAAGGYQLTSAQANTFSCLAKYESSCGTNITGARTVSGQPTTANGMFQIVLGYSDDCHSLNIPVCKAAAERVGYRVNGNLQCSRAFSGGRVKPGMEQLANACKAAAANLECNTAAAACLLKQNPSFSDWTADPRSHGQKACVAKFSNT